MLGEGTHLAQGPPDVTGHGGLCRQVGVRAVSQAPSPLGGDHVCPAPHRSAPVVPWSPVW